MILGAGGFAREVTDLCYDLGWYVVGYAVDIPDQPKVLLGKAVRQLEDWNSDWPCVAAIVSPLRKRILDSAVRLGFTFASVVHPSASVSKMARIHPGVIVNRNVTVGNEAVVRRHMILNRGCTIGHDCEIGIGVTVGPGANLAGNVRVGEWATIGMGANVREGTRIGAGAFIGMGSVVVEDVPGGETWWGIPARKIR